MRKRRRRRSRRRRKRSRRRMGRRKMKRFTQGDDSRTSRSLRSPSSTATILQPRSLQNLVLQRYS